MITSKTLTNTEEDFGPFNGRTWINCAHQGPLPRVAAKAAQRAIAMKADPHQMRDLEVFLEVPRRLRAVLARLIGVNSDDIILGNSASYGLNLLANGIQWRDGDEVLLVRGDFPATIFPWLPLRDRGVRVRFIEPPGPYVGPGDLDAQITPRTRVFCATWVHSLTGYAVDELALAEVCKSRDVLFVLNASQGLGYRPLNPREAGVDALTSCGFKWLCGPYGTGFCWIAPELRDSMRQTQGYWLPNLDARGLEGDFANEIRPDLGARAYDVFCTANFLNFMPWIKSVEYLLDLGMTRIAAHNDALVERLISNVDRDRYELLSPIEASSRTSIAVLRVRKNNGAEQLVEMLAERRLDVSLRRGALRVSPHVYNTERDIDLLLDTLRDFRNIQ